MMKQHTAKRTLFALLFSLMLVLLAMPCMAFAVGDSNSTDYSIASVTMDNGVSYTYYDYYGTSDTYTGESSDYVFTESNGKTATDALQAAITAANGGTVTLLKDVSTTATLAVSGTVTLDLNGKSITANATAGNPFSVITVSGSANFTLTDSGTSGYITNGMGTEDAGNSNLLSGGGVYVDGGTFIMEAGTISSNSAVLGAGVYVDGGTFTMNGGTISNRITDDSGVGGGVYVYGGTFTMNAGTISGNSTKWVGGGVYVSNGDETGTFNMTGGSITGNSSTSSYGGGVYVNSGTFNMSGTASISGNTATTGSYTYGGGVYVNSSGAFNMYGGTISGNTAISTNDDLTYGGGVYANGAFTMSGGSITGNTAIAGLGVCVGADGKFTMSGTASISKNTDTTRSLGGGVYVYGGTFTMNAGTISDNTVVWGGGGVNIADGKFIMNGGSITGNTVTSSTGGGVNVNGGSFNMTGGTISTNSASGYGDGVYVSASGSFTLDDSTTPITITGNTDDNVYLVSGKTITVDTNLTNGSSIGITMASTTGEFTTTGASATGVFTSDNAVYSVLTSVSGNVYSIGVAEASVTTNGITEEYATIEDAVKVANDETTDDVTIKLLTSVTTEATLDFTNEYVAITLDLNGFEIDAGDGDFSVINVNGADFTLTGTGTITGTSTVDGGVYVTSGSFTMEDGTITGGVYVADGTFTLDGAVTIDTIYLEDDTSIAVTANFSNAVADAIAVTTATTPTKAADSIAVVTGTNLTETVLGYFTSTNAAATEGVEFVLALDVETIYLAVAPTLTIGLDETTTSTEVVFTLATDIDDYTYVYSDNLFELNPAVLDGDTLSIEEAGVYFVIVTDTKTGLTKMGAAPVYLATFDYADDMLVGGLLQDDDSYLATFTLPTSTGRSGYTFKGWLADTITYEAGEEVTITADTDYTAVWSANAAVITYHIIGLGTNGYGSIAPLVNGNDYALVSDGGSAVFSFIPMDGYEVYEVYINGVAIGAQSFYSVTGVSANISVYVEFAPEGTLALQAAATAGATADGTSPTTGDPSATDDTATGGTTAGSTAADEAATAPEAEADDADAADAADADDAADAADAADAVQVVASTASGIGQYAVFAVAVFALAALGGACLFIAKKRVEDED